MADESRESPGPLAVQALSVAFEGLLALDKVDLELRRGEVLGLIGPNGAGKTTLLNVLSGFQRPRAGRVTLDGRDVTGLAPHHRARLGVGRTFQGARIFRALSVAENIEVGGLGAGLSRRAARARARDLMARFGLVAEADRPASSLPHGRGRRVTILRSLAAAPRFLLLDEPAAGLNEAESDDLLALIRDIRDDLGCGLLVIEHDMRLIMRLCDRIHVLDYGKTIASGPPGVIRCDPAVVLAYLGDRLDEAL